MDYKKIVTNREIKTDLKNILDLISCAGDYGFERDVLFDAFKDMLGGKLTYEEIEWYARSDGYNEEYYNLIKERLKTFKERYGL